MLTQDLNRHRMHRVTNFARHSSSEALTLDRLADVACLSRYHFARVFRDRCHETPIEFLARLRLEQAVTNLTYRSDMTVTDIALDAGFSSSQAFSNAFRRRFAISPRGYRQTSLTWQTSPAAPGNPVQLMTAPAKQLAYIRHRGPYVGAARALAARFHHLARWAMRHHLWTPEAEIICVCPDDPSITPPQFCEYDIGLTVPPGVREDSTISLRQIPAATFACQHVSGTPEDATKAWNWLCSTWLPHSGLNLAHHAFYEILAPEPRWFNSHQMQGYICIPVTGPASILTTAKPLSLNWH